MIKRIFNSRFQELLDESRRWKSDWIDKGREEAEVNLWPVLKKETNILRLTNQLHPNQNQYVLFKFISLSNSRSFYVQLVFIFVIIRIKRLGTEISSVQIIPPALVTLQSIVNTARNIRQMDVGELYLPQRELENPELHACHCEYGSSIVQAMTDLQRGEEEKLNESEQMQLPKNISIDENQEINRTNVVGLLGCRGKCRI